MNFVKGMKLAVTKKPSGACTHCNHAACQPQTDFVTVTDVRNGKVTVKSDLYGYGYKIVLDKFSGKIEVIA